MSRGPFQPQWFCNSVRLSYKLCQHTLYCILHLSNRTSKKKKKQTWVIHKMRYSEPVNTSHGQGTKGESISDFVSQNTAEVEKARTSKKPVTVLCWESFFSFLISPSNQEPSTIFHVSKLPQQQRRHLPWQSHIASTVCWRISAVTNCYKEWPS